MIILLYFISRLLMTHKMTAYDIFLYRHTLKDIHTGVAPKTVKCHPKFNLVEEDLSQGSFIVHPEVDTATVYKCLFGDDGVV